MISSMAQRPDGAGAVKRARLQMRAMAIAMAVVSNVVVLAVARIVSGEFPVATTGGDDQTIAFAQVVGVTIVVGLVAWGLLELLERTTSRAATIWLAIAIVVFSLSLIGPLANGADVYSKVVLALIHLATFATIAPMMWRSARLRCD